MFPAYGFCTVLANSHTIDICISHQLVFVQPLIVSHLTTVYTLAWHSVLFLIPAADPCERGPCHNGGTCVVIDTTTHMCLCPVGYSGTNCELQEENNCLTTTCPPGTICQDDINNSYQCLPLYSTDQSKPFFYTSTKCSVFDKLCLIVPFFFQFQIRASPILVHATTAIALLLITSGTRVNVRLASVVLIVKLTSMIAPQLFAQSAHTVQMASTLMTA